MKFILLLFCSLILVEEVSSQSILNKKILIVDEETKKPISNAHILKPDKKVGLISDSLGSFLLLNIPNNRSDTVLISHIGFNSKEISFDELVRKDTIRLKPMMFLVETVIISEKNLNILFRN